MHPVIRQLTLVALVGLALPACADRGENTSTVTRTIKIRGHSSRTYRPRRCIGGSKDGAAGSDRDDNVVVLRNPEERHTAPSLQTSPRIAVV